MSTNFRSIVETPPGGAWFWEDGDSFVSSPSYSDAIDKIRAALAAKGDTRTDPRDALAAYMCPRVPPGFCSGYAGPRAKTHDDYLVEAAKLKDMPLADAMTVASRLDRCATCPKCEHTVCLGCRNLDDRVRLLFGGRRAILSQDRHSGLCGPSGTYAMAVASVVYPVEDRVWEGTPKTCWRYDE